VGVRNNKTLVVLEKICAPFPRESAEKKANADIRRKNPQIDKSSFGRLAYLQKAEPLRLGVFARVNFFYDLINH
jgi:hypothetical protein